ncbi:uncharacterized protein BJX67DRAFT_392186 [Aspergillus lucknowensis]|uniref:Uncharacterized protein n=1 Tax=Aspergillus lucknowensis TaxID=176173 RepID=A0ABR4L5Y7_9EURO
MAPALLPSSAAAFAPRSSPIVVLNSQIEPWLTAILKRVDKRRLNNVLQYTRCLTEKLSSPNAIWTLCSIMFPKATMSESKTDENPLVEASFRHEIVHTKAYVVHVDMVYQHEVVFKLTPETIEELVNYHKEAYLVDIAANAKDWPERDNQLRKLHDEFIQAANKFVFRADLQALEGLDEDGAGELLGGSVVTAKTAILSLFDPLLSQSPHVAIYWIPLLPTSTGPELLEPRRSLSSARRSPQPSQIITEPMLWAGSSKATQYTVSLYPVTCSYSTPRYDSMTGMSNSPCMMPLSAFEAIQYHGHSEPQLGGCGISVYEE